MIPMFPTELYVLAYSVDPDQSKTVLIHACKNSHNVQIFKSYCKRVRPVVIITSPNFDN